MVIDSPHGVGAVTACGEIARGRGYERGGGDGPVELDKGLCHQQAVEGVVAAPAEACGVDGLQHGQGRILVLVDEGVGAFKGVAGGSVAARHGHDKCDEGGDYRED